MQIDDAIDARMRRLHLDEPLERAEVIAEMQVAGGLHAGKDALREWGHGREQFPLEVGYGLMATPKPTRKGAVEGASPASIAFRV
jgi:hypothetical protein